MARDACLGCGKPLPANKELASVPNGRLVAFDPDANRVWRICAKCHHWNLLGPEASAAAMPELGVRFASLPSAGPEGLAKAKVSRRLDLFRVGGAQERAARILALTKAKQAVVSDTVKGVSVFLMVFGAWQLYLAYNTLRHWGLAGIAATALATAIIGLSLPKEEREGNRYDRYLPIPLLLIGAGMTAAGLLAFKWAGATILAAMLFAVLARLDKGRATSLEWTPGGSDLRLREGSGTVDLGEFPSFLDPETVTSEQAAAAIDLLEELGSPAAALRFVAEQQGVPEGRLPFRDLSDEHRLLLAVAVRVAIVEPPHEVAAGLPDARMIAEEAEALDRLPEGS